MYMIHFFLFTIYLINMSMYTTTIIPLNLRKEETVVQVAESLNYLSHVSNDIFKRITKRIDDNTINLNALNHRLNNVNSKVYKISSAKKAIHVFSNSKYPAINVNVPYKSVFDHNQLPIKEKYHANYNDAPKDQPLENLQFYHLVFDNDKKPNLDGLGEIGPDQIEHTNNLLLYNTGTNPYSKYVLADTLKAPRKGNTYIAASGEISEICAAPTSITEPVRTIRQLGENYSYSPHLGDVPIIDVPVDLPDLPGIADDLRYINISDTIAPSVIITPSAPELPDLLPAIELIQTTEDATDKIVVVPGQTEKTQIIQKIEIKEQEKETDNVAKQIERKSEEVVEKVAQIDDAHASLMDAIRKAGGLKNAKLRSTEEKTDGTAKKTSGDLMEDLHSKLLMRRKGISGNKNVTDTDPVSAMNRISAMLPPPPTKTEQSESATSDDDWED